MKTSNVEKPNRTRGRPQIDRRGEILDAAEELFGTIGFEKTTVADIAEQLGMTQPNIYRTFKNRRELDEAVVARHLAGVSDTAWTIARRERPGDTPERLFREFNLAIMRNTVSMVVDNFKMFAVCKIASRDRWPVVDAFVEDLIRAVQYILERGNADGSFAVSDPAATARTIIDAMLKVFHPHLVEIFKNDDLEGSTRRITDLILPAIRRVNDK
jgi:AcrR family transcriptional regulator